jgi:hypothetical protein
MKLTTEELNQYKAAASLGLIPDDENPIFLFNQTHKDLLIDIINGRIDCVEMVKMQMKNRGLDQKTGKWIGWKTEEVSC